MHYKRILLKLSGEALMGSKQFGIDTDKLAAYALEIKNAVDELDKVVDNLTEQINAIETLLAAQAVVIKDIANQVEDCHDFVRDIR